MSGAFMGRAPLAGDRMVRRRYGTATNGVEMYRSVEIALALAMSNCLVRKITFEPRQSGVRVISATSMSLSTNFLIKLPY